MITVEDCKHVNKLVTRPGNTAKLLIELPDIADNRVDLDKLMKLVKCSSHNTKGPKFRSLLEAKKTLMEMHQFFSTDSNMMSNNKGT